MLIPNTSVPKTTFFRPLIPSAFSDHVMTIGGPRVLSDIRKALIVTTFVRRRHRIMSPIEPPLEVRGITEWQPELFNTTALIPRLSVKSEQVSQDWSIGRILASDWSTVKTGLRLVSYQLSSE